MNREIEKPLKWHTSHFRGFVFLHFHNPGNNKGMIDAFLEQFNMKISPPDGRDV